MTNSPQRSNEAAGGLDRLTQDGVDAAVAVFAPALLLNIEIHRRSDDRNDVHLHAGGQGYWVSRMIQALGVRAIPCGAIGGEPGEALRAIIAADGLDARLTPMTAPNAVIIEDRRDGARTTMAETDIVDLGRHDVDELYSSIVGAAMHAGVCVLTGTQLAPMFDTDTFRRLVSDLKHNDIVVIVDLCGEPLRAALEGGIDILKLSHEEFIADGWASSSGADAIATGIGRLRRAGAEAVVVSRSDRSTIVGYEEGMFEVRGPSLEVLDGRGGGDSMTAALAVAAAHRMTFEDGLRLAAAAGALNVSRHGLGTGRRDSIEEIAERVEIRPIQGHAAADEAFENVTKQVLYERARLLEIPRRSTMTRDELIGAIRAAAASAER